MDWNSFQIGVGPSLEMWNDGNAFPLLFFSFFFGFWKFYFEILASYFPFDFEFLIIMLGYFSVGFLFRFSPGRALSAICCSALRLAGTPPAPPSFLPPSTLRFLCRPENWRILSWRFCWIPKHISPKDSAARCAPISFHLDWIPFWRTHSTLIEWFPFHHADILTSSISLW